MKGSGITMRTLQQPANGLRRQKRMIVFALYFFAGAIALSGAFFSVYTLLNQISFGVLNTTVPGAVFGLIVVYFGLRSIFSVRKLQPQLLREDARFSWSNFRFEKKPAKNKRVKNRPY